ncbi:MAG: hypothetical protein JWM91_4755 [Rhodospirillales bacterium]|nr:hypothetical protein [Rhodospirillales bacterium]
MRNSHAARFRRVLELSGATLAGYLSLTALVLVQGANDVLAIHAHMDTHGADSRQRRSYTLYMLPVYFPSRYRPSKRTRVMRATALEMRIAMNLVD